MNENQLIFLNWGKKSEIRDTFNKGILKSEYEEKNRE